MEQFKWSLDRDSISIISNNKYSSVEELIFTKEGKIYHKKHYLNDSSKKAKIIKTISFEEVGLFVIENPKSSKRGMLKIFTKGKADSKFEYKPEYQPNISISINKKTYNNICLLYKILKENDIEVKTNFTKYFNTTILNKIEAKEKVFQEKKKLQCDKVGYYIEKNNTPCLISGARKFWIPLAKYAIVFLLSILSFLLLPKNTHITKWVIVGLWGAMTIISIWMFWHFAQYADNIELQYTKIINKLHIKKEWLNNKSFEQGENLKKNILKSVKKNIRKNNFWGIVIFDILTLVVGIGLYFSAKIFAWGIPMNQAMLFELFSVVVQNLIYIICVMVYLDVPNRRTATIIEEQFREYYWRKCPNCGGIMTHTVLSIKRERETDSEEKSIKYTVSNERLGTLTVGNERIGVYGNKEYTRTTKEEWHYEYIGKVIGLCHNCDKTENKEGQIQNIDYICPDGSVVKHIDTEAEKKNKEKMKNNKRSYI